MFKTKRMVRRLKKQITALEKDKVKLTEQYEVDARELEQKLDEDLEHRDEQIAQKQETLNNIQSFGQELKQIQSLLGSFVSKISQFEIDSL